MGSVRHAVATQTPIGSQGSSPRSSEGTDPPAPASDRTRVSERRVPSERESLSTLPGLEEDDEFEAHDTIPAPPWLDDELLPPLPSH